MFYFIIQVNFNQKLCVFFKTGVIQAHFNYNCICVLKEITVKMGTYVAETCW